MCLICVWMWAHTLHCVCVRGWPLDVGLPSTLLRSLCQQDSLSLFLPSCILQAIWPDTFQAILPPVCLPSRCRSAGITDAGNHCLGFLCRLWGLNSVIKLTKKKKKASYVLSHAPGPFPAFNSLPPFPSFWKSSFSYAFFGISLAVLVLSLLASQPHYLHLPYGNKYLLKYQEEYFTAYFIRKEKKPLCKWVKLEV